jgi:hypothetical protein
VAEVADRADVVVTGPPGVLNLLTTMADRLESASISSDPDGEHAITSMDVV